MRSFCWGKTVWSQPLAKDGLQTEYLGLQQFCRYLCMFLHILKKRGWFKIRKITTRCSSIFYSNGLCNHFILGLLIWRLSWLVKWGGPWPGPKSLNPKGFISWKGSLVTGGWGGLENSCLIGLTGLGGRVGGKWSDAAKSSRIYWSWPCSWTWSWWWWETSSWKSSKVSKRSGASKSSVSKVGNYR